MDEKELLHYGVPGMKWGKRKSPDEIKRQRRDSKADNDEDEAHDDYKKTVARKSLKAMSTKEIQEVNNRIQAENQFKELNKTRFDKFKDRVKSVAANIAEEQAKKFVNHYADAGREKLQGVIDEKTGLGRFLGLDVKAEQNRKAFDLKLKNTREQWEKAFGKKEEPETETKKPDAPKPSEESQNSGQSPSNGKKPKEKREDTKKASEKETKKFEKEVEKTKKEAEKAKAKAEKEVEKAKKEMEKAKSQSEKAKAEADKRKAEAKAEAAKRKAIEEERKAERKAEEAKRKAEESQRKASEKAEGKKAKGTAERQFDDSTNRTKSYNGREKLMSLIKNGGDFEKKNPSSIIDPREQQKVTVKSPRDSSYVPSFTIDPRDNQKSSAPSVPSGTKIAGDYTSSKHTISSKMIEIAKKKKKK